MDVSQNHSVDTVIGAVEDTVNVLKPEEGDALLAWFTAPELALLVYSDNKHNVSCLLCHCLLQMPEHVTFRMMCVMIEPSCKHLASMQEDGTMCKSIVP